MVNSTITDSQFEASDRPAVSNRRLWFEFAGTVGAWFLLGFSDVLISWRACVHDEQFGGPSSHPGAFALYFVMWALLFGLAVLAGVMSYKTWRKLSQASELLCAEGRERKEFMSLAGFFVSLTLGAGLIWMSLPLYIIEMCARTR